MVADFVFRLLDWSLGAATVDASPCLSRYGGHFCKFVADFFLFFIRPIVAKVVPDALLLQWRNFLVNDQF